MRLAILAPCTLSLALLFPAVAPAQEKPAEMAASAHFKLVFHLLQLDANGKVTNSRTYASLIATHGDRALAIARIRSGDRIPIQTELGKYEYVDVGTNIDAVQASVQDSQLSMHISAESSSAVKTSDPLHLLPLLRSTRWEANVAVPLDKPTIIFSSDNVSDTGKTELELTATQIP